MLVGGLLMIIPFKLHKAFTDPPDGYELAMKLNEVIEKLEEIEDRLRRAEQDEH